jgi:adenosine deaminase
MRCDGVRDLEDYLTRFATTVAVMQDAPALERIAEELVHDVTADGVRYLEVRYCPALSTAGGLSLSEVVHAVARGLQRGEAACGTVSRQIIGALRHRGPNHSMEMAELAVAERAHGVVAFDLCAAEAGNPARDHAAAFAYARRHDLAVTVHAGEGDGAHSIRDAIHECGAHRIGHGTRLREDAALRDFVRDRRIPLEVCPTSTVQTHVAPTFADHPLAAYARDGVVVTLSTDNRLMSGVSLTGEFIRCHTQLGLSFAELAAMALASFDAAFVDWPTRNGLREAAARDVPGAQVVRDALFVHLKNRQGEQTSAH